MEVKIKMTKDEKINVFHTALCNGLSYLSGYNIRLNYNQDEYINAKEKLKSDGLYFVCFEDVLIQMLEMGYLLTFEDYEYGHYTKNIGLNDVFRNIAKTPHNHIINIIDGKDNASDADAVLQTIIYKDIIFG